jgi:hypothetical protein
MSHAYRECASRIIPVENDNGIALRVAYESFLGKVLACTEYWRSLTIQEHHVQEAATATGLSLPQLVTLPQLLHNIYEFAKFTREAIIHQGVDIEVTVGALAALQIIFEAFQDDDSTFAYKETPEKLVRSVKLESPTGVSGAFFETDWDATYRKICEEGNNSDDEDAPDENEEDEPLEVDSDDGDDEGDEFSEADSYDEEQEKCD